MKNVCCKTSKNRWIALLRFESQAVYHVGGWNDIEEANLIVKNS